MSVDTPSPGDDDALSRAELEARVEELEETVADLEPAAGDGPKKMSIISTKGTLNMGVEC